MKDTHSHRFHIPVMGIGYTLDTPIKLAKYGISSVISIVQDDVIEKARKYYSQINHLPFVPISQKEPGYRSKRITAYLNLVNHLVNRDFSSLRTNPDELAKYARLLSGKVAVANLLQSPGAMAPGSIDVNIMTKLDRSPSGDGAELTEACSALQGYAESDLDSALVLSAGINPRLFAFIQGYADFFPNEQGYIKKRIIVKVSDFRSAMVQGKMLAKKGLWVSEFRIESGLNCGGHTFATEGLLLGPIMEEFKSQRETMRAELEGMCRQVWEAEGKHPAASMHQRLTVQGGLGTAAERKLMEDHYGVDSTGWGSPFLLVPEATSIDNETLELLARAGEEDIRNSGISPLGVAFNTVRNVSGERLKRERIAAGKPGSPCFRKHLALDYTYKEAGLCTASIAFQQRKIEELNDLKLSGEDYQRAYDKITEKECLCDGLAVSFLKKFDLMDKDNNDGVSVCPGPNLAYFDRSYSLEEMVGHIYGKVQVLTTHRPHVFVKELGLYVNYLKELIQNAGSEPTQKEVNRIRQFKANLLSGIEYYKALAGQISTENSDVEDAFLLALELHEGQLLGMEAVSPVLVIS